MFQLCIKFQEFIEEFLVYNNFFFSFLPEPKRNGEMGFEVCPCKQPDSACLNWRMALLILKTGGEGNIHYCAAFIFENNVCIVFHCLSLWCLQHCIMLHCGPLAYIAFLTCICENLLGLLVGYMLNPFFLSLKLVVPLFVCKDMKVLFVNDDNSPFIFSSRPQILVLCKLNEDLTLQFKQLLTFASQLKAGNCNLLIL